MEKNLIYGQNICLTKATLATAGAVSTFTTTGTMTYVVNGKFYTVAAQAGVASPTLDAVSGKPITLVKLQALVVVWCVDASGAFKVVATPINPNLIGADSVAYDGTTIAPTPPQFGQIPDTLTPFAYQILKAASTLVGTWTFGTSLWNATGLTVVNQDICTLPDRPQVS
jgi:hypothetical protein